MNWRFFDMYECDGEVVMSAIRGNMLVCVLFVDLVAFGSQEGVQLAFWPCWTSSRLLGVEERRVT
jgi:hypothetical protein